MADELSICLPELYRFAVLRRSRPRIVEQLDTTHATRRVRVCPLVDEDREYSAWPDLWHRPRQEAAQQLDFLDLDARAGLHGYPRRVDGDDVGQPVRDADVGRLD